MKVTFGITIEIVISWGKTPKLAQTSIRGKILVVMGIMGISNVPSLSPHAHSPLVGFIANLIICIIYIKQIEFVSWQYIQETFVPFELLS